jgi:hypothetical protein
MAPAHSDPFAVAVSPVEPDRRPWAHLYGLVRSMPRPQSAVVLVHGGPVMRDGIASPRDWPVFRGYAALIAAQGSVAVTFDHPLYETTDYPRSARAVLDVVDQVRREPGVAPESIALWAFSGAGLLAADWLRQPPTWLRCVGLTYPMLVPPNGWGVGRRFQPVSDALATTTVKIVLTRVGREAPDIASGVDAFIAAAPASSLQVVDLPNSSHGFDHHEPTRQAREGISRAVRLVTDAIASH